MENKNIGRSGRQYKDQSDESVNASGQPSAPQMEKEQPVVNEQEQVYPVNPQDGMFRQDNSDDFTSEKEMNQRSSQDENIKQNQQNAEAIESDSEYLDNGLKKTPEVNP